MDRKFLESMGIEKENIDKILDQNMAEIGALNTRIKTKDTEIATLRGELTAANTKVAELEKVDVQDLQTQLTQEREGRQKDRKEFALRSLLTGAGCTDVEYLMYKLGETVEFDDESSPQKKSLSTSSAIRMQAVPGVQETLRETAKILYQQRRTPIQKRDGT